MGRLGLVVGGHWESLAGSLGSALNAPSPLGSERTFGGRSGPVDERGDVAILARHGGGAASPGASTYVLSHELDHTGNMGALREAGCDRVLAIGSVGGLHPDHVPGTFVCPDDFIALDVRHRTALSGMAAHRVPGFDLGWRAEVVGAFTVGGREAGIDLRDGGVYWQVRGPRLETPAEIRLVAQHADVIGMTIASECVAAGELGLRYAAVCVVDNFANGVAESELTLAEVEAGRARNRETLATVLAAASKRIA